MNGQEFVIGGFTDPQRSRIGFGALLLGYYDDHGQLRYAGKVGTGFDDHTLPSLHAAPGRQRAAGPALRARPRTAPVAACTGSSRG